VADAFSVPEYIRSHDNIRAEAIFLPGPGERALLSTSMGCSGAPVAFLPANQTLWTWKAASPILTDLPNFLSAFPGRKLSAGPGKAQ
jgi:hypothetical protein